jgi:hypothetical protein
MLALGEPRLASPPRERRAGFFLLCLPLAGLGACGRSERPANVAAHCGDLRGEHPEPRTSLNGLGSNAADMAARG